MPEARVVIHPGETHVVKLDVDPALRALVLECDGGRGVFLDSLAVDGDGDVHESLFAADVPVMARSLNGMRIAMPSVIPPNAHVVAKYRNLSAADATIVLRLEAT
jgi:hypothetical protein